MGEADISEEDALAIDRDLFESMDRDSNGYLSRGEYYEFVLVKYGLVTKEVMEVLRQKFDTFENHEADRVSWAEIMTKRRLRMPRGRFSSRRGTRPTEQELALWRRELG